MDAFNTYMSNIPTDFFKSLCLKYGSAYTYKKREYISKEGDIFPYWGYIESGIIKYTCYNVTEKKNIIQDFPLQANLWLIIPHVFIISSLRFPYRLWQLAEYIFAILKGWKTNLREAWKVNILHASQLNKCAFKPIQDMPIFIGWLQKNGTDNLSKEARVYFN